MLEQKINENVCINTTKNIFYDFYNGNLETWLSYLNDDSVYLCNGEAILIGKNSIFKRFDKYTGVKQTKILRDEYFCIKISDTAYEVYGEFFLGNDDSAFKAYSRFSILYNIVKNKLSILHQHNSYEYTMPTANMQTKTLEINRETMLFIQELLVNNPLNERISVRSGKQTILINPSIILYIESNGKHSDIICIDRHISCNTPFNELVNSLPDFFYRIHRSYIVNTRFIVTIRRFEVELISKITLPIPEHSYTSVKKDILSKYLHQYLPQKNSNSTN